MSLSSDTFTTGRVSPIQVSTVKLTWLSSRHSMLSTARRDLPLKSINPRQPETPFTRVKLPSTGLPFRRGMVKVQLWALSESAMMSMPFKP
ncbi:hypothetical protein D3C85_1317380 [compost metagenome]